MEDKIVAIANMVMIIFLLIALYPAGQTFKGIGLVLFSISMGMIIQKFLIWRKNNG